MKITKSTIDGIAGTMAGNVGAGGVTVIDTGGYFTGTTLEEILAEIGAGTAPGSFLTVVLGGQGTVQALGTLGATETIDLANANKFWGTLDQACTISTTGWTNLKDCAISVELIQNGTGGWTPTFSGVTWIGGTPAWVTTASTVTHIVLFSRDGGTTIYGAVVGGGSPLTIKDEGSSLATSASSIDFVGAGVTASGTGAGKTVTIPGATFATPAIVLGTAAAAGAASTGVRTDATIVAFDATVPTTQAFGDAAATGSAAVASRRDHLHGMPSAASTVHEVVMVTGSIPPDPVLNSAGDDWIYS